MNIKSNNHLVRALGLTALIIYGLGDILGAGIYALIGKVAGHAGPLTWVSFAIAMAIVLLTALSYSELGSRMPRSGGVSVYIQEAFKHPLLSTLGGFLLFAATVFSMSTLSQAFVGYLKAFGFNFPDWLGITSFLIILLMINFRGIKLSSAANILSTFVELSGLLIVLICGFLFLAKTKTANTSFFSEALPSIKEIFQGAALAFFAFTGFEDLANIAEEVKQPEKNLPRALLSSLVIAGLFYLLVSWVATAIVPSKVLSESSAPLLEVVKTAYPPMPIYIFSLIAMFAVFNTTLLNYITASRLLYGMAEAKLLPTFLCRVHKHYHTPYISILLIFPIVLFLGLSGTLKGLASATSAIVLTVFSFSNIALIKIKLRERKNNVSTKIFKIPLFVPCLAVILNITAICFLPITNILAALSFIVAGLIISFVINKLT